MQQERQKGNGEAAGGTEWRTNKAETQMDRERDRERRGTRKGARKQERKRKDEGEKE